ncbi:MAG TPA: hypothetical protein VLI67_05220 [Vicinamibacteria bacterium]|nr:hypothetical protein [Vicinamibacteria bacterium]
MTSNGAETRPATTTRTVAPVAPPPAPGISGTSTSRAVVVDFVTRPDRLPNRTALSQVSRAKFVPWMVTTSPGLRVPGTTPATVGVR